MINELYPFQRDAVEMLRQKVSDAQKCYESTLNPQVVSLQAPTGSGKTIMMAALIERIFTGDALFEEMPDAVFVWLSDSPELNQQSKDKIDQRADRIRPGQTEVISEESFNRETLEDGKVYFLNTQKLSKSGKLGKHEDNRQFTIWETLENTANEKPGRLFFIIDEAHRGMLGTAAGHATTIMQRFLKGWDGGEESGKMRAMPVVIGMSATPERFNRLVAGISSTQHPVVIGADQVRASGLLKDQIIISHPEDESIKDDFAVLASATQEWMDKCAHWADYCTRYHYRNVDPVFVVQVKAADRGHEVSATDLDQVVATIEKTIGRKFDDGEIVHTFGSTGELTLNGRKVRSIQPSQIAEDRSARVVLFKENLSTGWDCPRAETMMSFRTAEDRTFIAQLLGRMIRTPLQCRVKVDESLNNVRLFLPYFDMESVNGVIDELKASECSDIPADIEAEAIGTPLHVPWTVHVRHPKDDPNQQTFESIIPQGDQTRAHPDDNGETPENDSRANTPGSPQPQANGVSLNGGCGVAGRDALPTKDENPSEPAVEQLPLPIVIDRPRIIRAINGMALATYTVRSVRINDYVKSMTGLALLLARAEIDGARNAISKIREVVVGMIRDYADEMMSTGRYDELAEKVRNFKLVSEVFDTFAGAVKVGAQTQLALYSDDNIERQFRMAEQWLGGCGFTREYARRWSEGDLEDGYKIDCILFAADKRCIENLRQYAEKTFHELNDGYRRYLVDKDERTKSEYDAIVTNGDPVSKHNLALPEYIDGGSAEDGKDYQDHLYADVTTGLARMKLNSWEEGVVEEERQRPDFACWVRNTPNSRWALCVPRDENGEKKPFYPDFLIVRWDGAARNGFVVDILEPHGPQFADNLSKAKALAEYAETEDRIGRVQMIRRISCAGGASRFVRLDLGKGAVRTKVRAVTTDAELNALFE